MASHPRIKLSLDSRQANVPLAGSALRAIGQASGFDADAAGMLQLALEEALTNVIRHSYQSRPGFPLEVEIAVHPDRLTLVVSHQGQGLKAWPPRTNAAPPVAQEGGRGIFLINAIMDQVRYTTTVERSCLTMTKRRVVT